MCCVILVGVKFCNFEAKNIYKQFWRILSGALSEKKNSYMLYFAEFILVFFDRLLKYTKVSIPPKFLAAW